MAQRTHSSGFAIPLVIIVGSTLVVLALVILQTVASLSTYTRYQYHTKLAEEAAEAGAAYATACLELKNHIQTWGNTPSTYLTPSSDCFGNQGAYPNSTVVAFHGNIKTSFSIGDLDYATAVGVQISAKGTAGITIGKSSVPSRSFSQSIKKSITWAANFEGSRSVSGTNRTCAIMSGSVYCWGYNRYGQLGNGQYIGTGNIDGPSSIDSNVPVRVKKETGKLAGKLVVDVFSAQYHNCALTSEGKVYCWGYNNNGQLGNGTRTTNGAPYEVGGALTGKVVTAIGGTADVSCAIAEGKIYCWGDNSQGLVGNNVGSGIYTTPQLVVASNTSTTLPTNYIASSISTSGSRSDTICALVGGKAYCWGRNTIGEIGDGSTTRRNLPTKVTDTGVLSGKTVTAISQDGFPDQPTTGYTHVCVVASGAVYCWGENSSGQLGRGANNTTDSKVPVAVYTGGALSGKTVTDVAVGLRHTCALANNEVYCWGSGVSGQVGDGSFSNTPRYVPVKVRQDPDALLGATILRLGAGANRGCAVVSTGKSFCWGLNGSGQIGDGTLDNRSVPTESIFLRPKNNEFIY